MLFILICLTDTFLHMKSPSAVRQGLVTPAENGDLVMRLADRQRFVLRIDAETMIDIVNAIFKPDAAVAAQPPHFVNCDLRAGRFDAIVGNLPAGLIVDDLASFERQTVAVGELANRADVNHCSISLSVRVISFTLRYDYTKSIIDCQALFETF